MSPSRYYFSRGVSLIEFVLGLTILAIVLVGVGLFFASQPRQLDPVFQFRAASLAEALAEQVWSVKYDTNNDPNLQTRCGVTPDVDCKNVHQASTTNIKDFFVLDDFQKWCDNGENGALGAIDGETLASDLGMYAPELYSRFSVTTCVKLPPPLNPGYDKTDPDLFIKKITMIISIDSSDTLSFELHRYNLR
ncbi:prepilin-type cleavage/methylation-like protein [Oceanisphaera sp. IT1-181]|uniref:prepilin-type cleavage/methylation-like protein n=1 Tax=Oceanisphaera sp. IT1-181 TaxID=3081199 RepID=UPI0029CA923B|nr:prepilin-type cleavage/methylation-like protein [Oceanisphaera sp. IT1-181]